MAILADRFYDSYDMLPVEYKRELYNSRETPTMADLEAAWKLVQETRSFDDLFRDHARKYDPDEYKIIRDAERAAAQREREKRKEQARTAKQRKIEARLGHYETRWYPNPHYNPNKNMALIERVKADEALDLVTKRKAKLVNTTQQYIPRQVWVAPETRTQREARIRREENAKAGCDIYAAPRKDEFRAGTNRRLDNAF